MDVHSGGSSPTSAETFRQLGHQVVDLVADQLARSSRREGPVLPWLEPAAQLKAWPSAFPEEGGGDALEILGRAVREGIQLHHPRYLGHQCTAPLPLAGLCDLVASTLNNGMAVYEMGPVGVALEQHLVRFFCGELGFDPALADGVLTSGGSTGNLTALLAARQARAPHDAWDAGNAGAPMSFVCSDQAHYSVRRAAQILGLGSKGCLFAPSDEAFRLRPEALERTLDRATGEGRLILAVVGSAGSTNTGAIDPLDELADVCERRRIWFHVDGAHGAAGVLSPALKPRLTGLERADSVVLDAHKMLLMPALATFVLYRDGAHSFQAFSQEASYIYGQDPRSTWFDLGQRTLECTKRMIGLKLYVALQVYGPRFFGDYLARMQGLSQGFAKSIRARPHWELATEPDLNIVCFRFHPPHVEDGDALQARIRTVLRDEGSFYIVQTRLRGRTWLRTTIINPETEASDLDALMARIEGLVSG